MMWAHLNPFCYDPFLANCLQPSFCYSFPCPSFPAFELIAPLPPLEESPPLPEKSYRETVEEIEQKPMGRGSGMKKKKIQKSRFIIKKEKEDNFERKKQKKDRNLPSNICKYFVSYLYHHPRPETILQRQNNTQGQSRVTDCIEQLRRHLKTSQTYIRPGLLESLCRGGLLGNLQSETLRTLFRRFIISEFRMMISMTKKLTKKQKVAYFKLGRKFMQKFTTNN